MQEQKEHRELAYSPVGMSLDKLVGKEAGWGTFLFTTSRACPYSCPGCWTYATKEIIEEQLKLGTDWLYDGRYGLNLVDTMLQIFKEQSGKLVACMSDGEPFDSRNYDWTLKLAESCGKQDLPFLLFTNGALFDKEKLEELGKITNGKITYCVSMQTGIRERYGLFACKDKPNCEGPKKWYDNIIDNLPAWREYNTKILEKTGKHGIMIHTWIKPPENKNDKVMTEEQDLEAVKDIVHKLGDVHWCVTPPGKHALKYLRGESIELSERINRLIEKYSTGPTATLTIDGEKLCSYIAHGFYPLMKGVSNLRRIPKGVFGITFNPYYRSVQSCPYYSDFSTRHWLNLEDYLNSLRDSGTGTRKEHIAKWIDYAIKAETLITKAAFDVGGKYEPCLMRHSNAPKITSFISRVNEEMARHAKELDTKDPKYFDSIISELRRTIDSLVERKPVIIYKRLAVAAAIIATLGFGVGVHSYKKQLEYKKYEARFKNITSERLLGYSIADLAHYMIDIREEKDAIPPKWFEISRYLTQLKGLDKLSQSELEKVDFILSHSDEWTNQISALEILVKNNAIDTHILKIVSEDPAQHQMVREKAKELLPVVEKRFEKVNP